MWSVEQAKKYHGDVKYKGQAIMYYRLVRDIHIDRYKRYKVTECWVHLFLIVFLAVLIIISGTQFSAIGMESAVLSYLGAVSFPSNSLLDPNPTTFQNISSLADVSQYVLNVIQPMVNSVDAVENSNILLWGVRFRKIEVVSECSWGIPYPFEDPGSSYYCTPLFNKRDQATGPSNCYPYMTAEETKAPSVSDGYFLFPGSGYVYDLALPIPENEANNCSNLPSPACVVSGGNYSVLYQLSQLFDLSSTNPYRFITEGTVVMIISMGFYNPSVDWVTYTQIVFSILPSGVIIPAIHSKNGSSSNGIILSLGARVSAVAVIFMILLVIRILMVVRHLYLVFRCFKGHNFRIAGKILIDAVLVALLICSAVDIGIRFGVVTAGQLQKQMQYMKSADELASYLDQQRIFSQLTNALLMYLAAYVFLYMNLYKGPRFLYFVGTVALKEIVTVLLIMFLFAIILSIWLYIAKGMVAFSYDSFGLILFVTLSTFAGFDSLPSLNYDIQEDGLNRATFYVYIVCYVILFRILFWALYESIFIAAFGRVFNYALISENKEEIAGMPNIQKGIDILESCRRWVARVGSNITFGHSKGSSEMSSYRKEKCGFCKAFFCLTKNPYEKFYLSDVEILERLDLWKNRLVNSDRYYLTYKELRDALRGDPSIYKYVDCHQIDALFEKTIVLSPEEAKRLNQEITQITYKQFLIDHNQDNTETDDSSAQKLYEIYQSMINLHEKEIKSVSEVSGELDRAYHDTNASVSKLVALVG